MYLNLLTPSISIQSTEIFSNMLLMLLTEHHYYTAGIMMLFICPSVMWQSGSVYRVKTYTGQRVPSRQLPISSFTHFCCRVYHLATKRTKKRTEETLHKFFQTQAITARTG